MARAWHLATWRRPFGDCLKGNRKPFFDNSVNDAIGDPGHLYEEIRGRNLKYAEAARERQIRVIAERGALRKGKNESRLDFEAQWENVHRNAQRAGPVRTSEEHKVDNLSKVGDAHSRVIGSTGARARPMRIPLLGARWPGKNVI